MNDIMSKNLINLLDDENFDDDNLDVKHHTHNVIIDTGDKHIPGTIIQITGNDKQISTAVFKIDDVMVADVLQELSVKNVSYLIGNEQKAVSSFLETNWEQMIVTLKIEETMPYIILSVHHDM